jgi:hypothetical protein
MPLFDDFSDFDIEMINILIKKEQKEQKEQQNDHFRPFLELPVPNFMEKPPKTEEIEENDGIIIIDL